MGIASLHLSYETISDLILRSGVFAASRRMAADSCLASILRDARKGALLRMRSEMEKHLL
jgi:hypothetical protein